MLHSGITYGIIMMSSTSSHWYTRASTSARISRTSDVSTADMRESIFAARASSNPNLTFSSRCCCWPDGTRPEGSTPSASCGSLGNSTIQSRSSFTSYVTFHPYCYFGQRETLVLHCEFESRSASISSSINSATPQELLDQSSTLSCDRTIVYAEYGILCRLFLSTSN